MIDSILINDLSFYWRINSADMSLPNVVPDLVPFEFDYMARHGLIIQKRVDSTLEFLNTIYKEEYNVGYLQEHNTLAQGYAKDLTEFLGRHVPNPRNALEIGCGGCVILAGLSERGIDVVGIDPSPVAKEQGSRLGIRVIEGFFPSTEITEQFDLVFHADVLEHVVDPVAFLRSQREVLSPDGTVVISVPDCTESIEAGDISMIIHQHLNYFDTDSLRQVATAAGLEPIIVEPAGYGGSLYCVARNPAQASEPSPSAPEGFQKSERFARKSAAVRESVSDYFRDILNAPGRQLGLYVPLRAFPYLADAEIRSGYRLFDDTPHWHGQCFDGVPIPIENFSDLENDPVSDVVVMSLTFGDVIKRKLVERFGKKIRVKALPEFFEEEK